LDVHGVEDFGPVEFDGGDVILFFIDDAFKFHAK
jgi:hypothetical protein